MTESSAATEGPEWSARAQSWASQWASLADPARTAVADAVAIEAGTRVLDIGCGSGEFLQLATARGAAASGLDAAEGMIAIASQRLPDADLRVGAMEALPYADGAFDVVTAFNAFQFAADFAVALAEAARVTRRGGRVAICNWGREADRDLARVYDALSEPGRFPARPLGEPGVLEELARGAGLSPGVADYVDVPYEAPDLDALVHALRVGAGFEGAGDEVVRVAAAPFRRGDGSYRFENTFRYLIAQKTAH